MATAHASARVNLRELEPFVGRWKMTGHAYESPFGSETDVSADELFEWLTGGRFLIHRLQGRLGDDEMACIEILGRTGNGRAFTAHTFYNDGSSNTWHLEDLGGTWTLTGEWPREGNVLAVRCTIMFADRTHRRATWEYSADRSTWKVFWLTEATRID